MAVLWFGPFYIVVLWTVVSSFLGSTWSARNIYDDYLDNEVRAAAAHSMEDQQELRKDTSREQAPYDEDGRYLYGRITSQTRNRNLDPNLIITDLWDSQKAENSVYKDDSSNDPDLSEEMWLSPNFQILKNSGQMSYLGDGSRSKQSGLGSGPLKNLEVKRQSHSLSIVNPLDVLRQQFMLDMARRRMKENQQQIKANDVILKTMGKRKKRETSEKENFVGKKMAVMKRKQSKDYLVPSQDLNVKHIRV